MIGSVTHGVRAITQGILGNNGISFLCHESKVEALLSPRETSGTSEDGNVRRSNSCVIPT